MNSLKNLQRILKINFSNPKILESALIHRSYLNENKKIKQSNERLEYLGDAALELIVSDFLFQKFPQKKEGELTDLRSKIVQTKTLASVASKLSLGDYLYLAKGEEQSDGRKNSAILADTFEALIGAIYLDQGFEKTKVFVQRHLLDFLDQILKDKAIIDYKSQLQEFIQSKGEPSPIYKIIKEAGPDHDKTFTTAVSFFGKTQSLGFGKSKQEAEQAAAKKALEKIIPK